MITTLSLFAPMDLSAVVGLLTIVGALISLYIKQIKDISEIKLNMKRDKDETDREIALIKIDLDARGKKDDEIVGLLNDIKTNQAVFSEKIENMMETGTSFARERINNLENKIFNPDK